MTSMSDVRWRKPSHSTAASTCVEVRCDDTMIFVRDGKDPDGPRLGFTRAEWQAFIDGVKAGEFDLEQRVEEA